MTPIVPSHPTWPAPFGRELIVDLPLRVRSTISGMDAIDVEAFLDLCGRSRVGVAHGLAAHRHAALAVAASTDVVAAKNAFHQALVRFDLRDDLARFHRTRRRLV